MKTVICVSGYKNSGKTTLIQKLIVEYRKKGILVSVLKHDGHIFDMPNSDTDLFHQVGCEDIVIFDKDKSMHIQYHEPNIESLIDALKYDLIFIEGLKHSQYPKLYIEDGYVYPSFEDNRYARDDIDSIVNSITNFTKVLKNDTL